MVQDFPPKILSVVKYVVFFPHPLGGLVRFVKSKPSYSKVPATRLWGECPQEGFCDFFTLFWGSKIFHQNLFLVEKNQGEKSSSQGHESSDGGVFFFFVFSCFCWLLVCVGFCWLLAFVGFLALFGRVVKIKPKKVRMINVQTRQFA